MSRYKPVDRNPKVIPVVLSEQMQPRTFEFTLDHWVDHELDLSALDAKFKNDVTGAAAYDPRVMLKIVLLAYSSGLIGKELFAIDGVKLPSNASKERSGTHAQLLHRADRLEKAALKSNATDPESARMATRKDVRIRTDVQSKLAAQSVFAQPS